MNVADARYLFKVDKHAGDGRKKSDSVREIYVLAHSLEDVSKGLGFPKCDVLKVTTLACDHPGCTRFSNPTILFDFTKAPTAEVCS